LKYRAPVVRQSDDEVPRTARGGMVRLKYRAPVVRQSDEQVPRTARGGMVRLKYRAPVVRPGAPNCTGRYGTVEIPCACQPKALTTG